MSLWIAAVAVARKLTVLCWPRVPRGFHETFKSIASERTTLERSVEFGLGGYFSSPYFRSFRSSVGREMPRIRQVSPLCPRAC